jgi:hypothetical protein
MNYQKLYNQIIENRKQNPLPNNEYGEVHHVIPKSLGGDNEKENLVKLSAREHFICHYLLTKMYENDTISLYKMTCAFLMMKCSNREQQRYFNSKLYERLRTEHAKYLSETKKGTGLGKENSQYGNCWIYHDLVGKIKTIKKTQFPEYYEQGWILSTTKTKERKLKKRVKERKLKVKPKVKKQQNWKQYINNVFIQYLESDCNSIRDFCRKGFYDKSYVNLSVQFKWYIDGYSDISYEGGQKVKDLLREMYLGIPVPKKERKYTNFCIDCGTGIDNRAKRCRICNVKLPNEKRKFIPAKFNGV